MSTIVLNIRPETRPVVDPVIMGYINELRAGNPECNHLCHHACSDGLGAYAVLAKVVGLDHPYLTQRMGSSHPLPPPGLVKKVFGRGATIKVDLPADLHPQAQRPGTEPRDHRHSLSRQGLGWYTRVGNGYNSPPLTHSQLADLIERFGLRYE